MAVFLQQCWTKIALLFRRKWQNSEFLIVEFFQHRFFVYIYHFKEIISDVLNLFLPQVCFIEATREQSREERLLNRESREVYKKKYKQWEYRADQADFFC